jgi:HEAT repeat protein
MSGDKEYLLKSLSVPGLEQKAAFQLRNHNDPEVRSKLRALLWHPEPHVQGEILRTLAGFGDEAVYEPCAHLICHGSELQKEYAIVALSFLGTLKAMSLLETLLSSANPDDRLHAAYMLARHHRRDGESVLIQALPVETSLHWRLTIISCLASFGHKDQLHKLREILTTGSKAEKEALRCSLPGLAEIHEDGQESWEPKCLAWVNERLQRTEG